MKSKFKSVWVPRILAIIYVLFLSIFSLDVFGGGYGFWGTIVALFMHLVPSFVLLVLLLVSWKKEKLGGILFVLIGVIFAIFFKTYEDMIVFLLISGIPILIGALFFLDHPSTGKATHTKKRS